MPDVMTKEARSRLMARIRGRDTGPEIRLRKVLWARGIRYRLKSRLPGRPDLVIARFRAVVFVDGCFWHGCGRHFVLPGTRRMFWTQKIRTNQARDKKVRGQLRRQGWHVIRVWEHDIRADTVGAGERVYRAIKAG